MPAKKKDPATELADKMLQVLDAQRRLGGESYPLRLRRLAELTDPAASEDTIRKAAGKKKPFGERAVVVNAKDPDSPVALAGDAEQLAGSTLLLDYLLGQVCRPDKPTCDPAKLKTKLPKPLKEPFAAALRRRIDENRLPPGVGLVSVKEKQHLHLQRYSIPWPPEEVLAEDLVRALRAQRARGDSAYPLTLAELLRQVPSRADDGLLKKTLAVPAFTGAVVLAMRPLAGSLGDTPVALAEDRDRLADSPAVLTAALKRARDGEAQIFQPADLAKQVVPALKKPLETAVRRRAEEGALPPGVGCLFQKKGKPLLFLLSDVAGVRSTEEQPPARAEPASTPVAPPPAIKDFARRFDEAFRQLDEQDGLHNHVSLVDLRRVLPVDRDKFDAGLQALRAEGRYGLSAAEERGGITADQQVAAVVEHGTHLLYVSRK